MAPQDSVGRIHKNAFVIATSTMFAIAMLSVVLRIGYRIARKQISIDDVVMLSGAAALVISFAVIQCKIVDQVYLMRGLQTRIPGVVPPGNPPGNAQAMMDFTNAYHNWSTVAVLLSFYSAVAAKFTFLSFFWKLIDRIYLMKACWWVAFVANVGAFVYTVTVTIVVCPYYNDVRILQCDMGDMMHRSQIHAIVSMALDLFGDVMILIIPFAIVWNIRVRTSQKIALFLSLGLTVFVMIASIIKVSGFEDHGQIDYIWHMYWLFLGGCVGIFMAAALALRPIFVARSKGHSETVPQHRRFFGSSIVKRFRNWNSLGFDTENSDRLPDIPGAQLTGMRTFIDQQGESRIQESERHKTFTTPSEGTGNSSRAWS